MSKKLEVKNQKIENIDEEVMEAISGGNFTDEAKEKAKDAWKWWQSQSKGVRGTTYALLALAAIEGGDQLIFKGKGTEYAINYTGKGIKYTGKGIKWLGNKMESAKIARTAAVEQPETDGT